MKLKMLKEETCYATIGISEVKQRQSEAPESRSRAEKHFEILKPNAYKIKKTHLSYLFLSICHVTSSHL